MTVTNYNDEVRKDEKILVIMIMRRGMGRRR
jgi:hypothetical protein